MKLEELVKKYNNGDEFEHRFELTIKQFKEIMAYLANREGHSVQFDNSVSIAFDRKRLVRKHYDSKMNASITYITKTEKGRMFSKHHLYGKVKTILVEEVVVDKFIKMGEIQNLRIKPRISIILAEAPEWRFDFTPSKEMRQNFTKANIKESMDRMFIQAHSILEYMEKVNLNAVSGMIEVEIEYIGTGKPNTPVDTLISMITPRTQDMANSVYYDSLHRIIQLLGRKVARGRDLTVKQVSNQVVALSHVAYRDEVQTVLHSFDLKHKTDGVRALVLMEDSKEIILTSKAITCDNKSSDKPTIYDAEFDEDKNIARIFDVLMFKGEKLTDKAYHIRKKKIPDVVKMSSVAKAKKIEELKAGTAEKQMVDFYEKQPDYETDGLILTPRAGTYFEMTVYKWKPLTQITIDFYIKKCPRSMSGRHPYITRPKKCMYLLFCGGREDIRHKFLFPAIRDYHTIFPTIANAHYRPTLFRHPQNHHDHIYYDVKDDLDGKIGEFHRSQSGDWTLVRIREDRQVDVQSGRYFGNDYKTASNTYDNYYDPLNLTDILKGPDHGYFAGDNADYAVVRKFNSYVKEKLIRDNSDGGGSVIDLSAGQGQDLMRYPKYNFNKYLGIDLDSHAIARLNTRRYNISNPMAIWTMIADLNSPKAQTYQRIIRHFEIPQIGVDMVVCNFALHYMSSTLASIRNFMGLIPMVLQKGKPFIATFFDRQSIIDLIEEEKSGEWTIKEKGKIRYSIKRKNKGKMAKWGEKISIVLPFSDGKYYDEPLINYEELVVISKRMGLEVDKTGLFSEFFGEKNMPTPTNDIDKKFIGLYRWVVFKATKGPKNLKEDLLALV